jgi:20S proteasome alpha/beta subunit
MIAVNSSRPSIEVDFRPTYQRPLPKPQPKEKPVTIAAGFRYRDGILLCADREITQGTRKFSQCKIYGEQSPGVSLGFTFAGSVNYAEMAIQEITAVVKSSHLTTHGEIWVAIKDIIHDIYVDSIGGVLESRQTGTGFNLLVAAWAEGSLKLYATDDTAITEVPQFRCIGIGEELAKYVLERDFVQGSDRMSLQTVEVIALRILEHAKQSVTHCGKETDVLILGSDGEITRKTQNDYRYELRMIDLFDDLTSLLLPFALELGISNEERQAGFRLALSSYFDRMAKIRAEKRAVEEDS